MHIDKISSAESFHSNSQRSSHSFSRTKFKSCLLGRSYAIISQTVTDWTNTAIADVYERSRMLHFDWHIYILPWAILKANVTQILTCNILQTSFSNDDRLRYPSHQDKIWTQSYLSCWTAGVERSACRYKAHYRLVIL